MSLLSDGHTQALIMSSVSFSGYSTAGPWRSPPTYSQCQVSLFYGAGTNDDSEWWELQTNSLGTTWTCFYVSFINDFTS